jgi:hypothetical protein
LKGSKNLPEPLQFIKVIHDKGVKYLLIGRQAVIAYGGPVQSMDYDIYIDGSEENTNKLLEIAEDFSLSPSISKKDMHKTFKFKLENEILIDVFRAKSLSSPQTGKILFEDIYKRKVIAKDPNGLEINLPCLDDLITLKKMRSAPKDLLDVQYLQEIKKTQNK